MSIEQDAEIQAAPRTQSVRVKRIVSVILPFLGFVFIWCVFCAIVDFEVIKIEENSWMMFWGFLAGLISWEIREKIKAWCER